jgi:hypothetical protein
MNPSFFSLEKSWRWILLLAALLYSLQLNRHYMGFLSDDGNYIVGARSILHGSYREMNRPEAPAQTLFLPGFSLFLSPFVAAIDRRWASLQAVPIGLLLLSVLLLWRLFKDRLSLPERALAVLLFAVNPVVVNLSTLLLAEGWYLVLSLWILIRLDVLLKRDAESPEWIWLGILLGWATLTRPEGISLAAAIALIAITPRYRRRVLGMLAPALIMWSAWLARNYSLTHHVSDYVFVFHWDIRPLDLLLHLWRVLDTLFVQWAGLVPPDIPFAFERLLHPAALLVGVCLTGLGAVRSSLCWPRACSMSRSIWSTARWMPDIFCR